jgi:hypothetical protein
MENELKGLLLIVLFGILIVGFVVLEIMPIGLIQYGQGETNGIITTVEEGIIFDYVWVRASGETSQTDRYCFTKESLKPILKQTAKQRELVTVHFNKFLLGGCSDQVVGVN